MWEWAAFFLPDRCSKMKLAQRGHKTLSFPESKVPVDVKESLMEELAGRINGNRSAGAAPIFVSGCRLSLPGSVQWCTIVFLPDPRVQRLGDAIQQHHLVSNHWRLVFFFNWPLVMSIAIFWSTYNSGDLLLLTCYAIGVSYLKKNLQHLDNISSRTPKSENFSL